MAATAETWLDDILAHPDDDAPRLIFADWLEEYGDEARAEFIRVQCELARLREPEVKTPGNIFGLSDEEYDWANCCGGCRFSPATKDGALCRWHALCRRERELLEAHGDRWRLEATGHVGCPLTGVSVFRRGFVAAITCTLADWCGATCGRCRGWRWLEGVVGETSRPGVYLTDLDPCPDCRGGCGPGHGPALVRAAPLKRVMLSDREPQNYHNNPSLPGHDGPLFGWRRETDRRHGPPHNLPPDVWDRVAEHPRRIDNGQWADFRKRADAIDALSAALLAWARAQPATS